MARFDPAKEVGVFQGQFNKVECIDPAYPGQIGNLVINPDKTFDINIEWQLTGNEVDLYLNHDEAEDNWRINAFAETMGPGEDLIVYRGDLPKADGVEQGAGADYKVVFTHSCHYTPDPGPKLQEHIPNANSGVYKLVITVFLNNRSNMGYDIAGFHEGPMIMAEPLA